MLPFPGFEDYVSAKIYQRGLDYFQNDTVQTISHSGDSWKATVLGTDAYRVKVTIKDRQVTKWSCTCPYEDGPVCKHVVALLLAIQEQEEPAAPGEAAKDPGTRPGTLKDLLDTLTPDQLREALLYSCHHYPALGEELFLRYTTTGDSIKAHATAFIHKAVRKLQGRYGYIPWEDQGDLLDAFDTVLEQAQDHHAKGAYHPAADTALALIESLAPLLEELDDSNGAFGDYLEEAFTLLEQLPHATIPPGLREELFAYYLSAFKSGLGAGFDFHWRWLWMAVELVQAKDEERRLLTVLDNYEPDRATEWSDNYDKEQVLQVKLALYQKTRTPEEVARLQEENLRFPSVRRVAVENAYKTKNWERAKQLCRDGIRQSRKDHLPGLEVQWYEWLLKIAHAQKDKAGQVEAAEFLLGNGQHSLDAYHLLKSLLPFYEWNERRAHYLSVMKKHYAVHGVMRILMEEGKAEEVEAMLSERSSFEFLLEWEKPLLKTFPDVLKRQFPPLVLRYIELCSGRSDYQRVASLLKRVKKGLGPEAVGPTVNELRTRYPKRRALLEELKGL